MSLALIKVAQAQLLQGLIAVLAVSTIFTHCFSWLRRNVPWCCKCPDEVKFLDFSWPGFVAHPPLQHGCVGLSGSEA